MPFRARKLEKGSGTENLQYSDQQPVAQTNNMYTGGESSNSELQQHQDIDSTDVFNDRPTTEQRLSPNLFLNLNFENSAASDQNPSSIANSLTFEWSTGSLNVPNGSDVQQQQQQQHQHQQRSAQYQHRAPTPPPSAILNSTDSQTPPYDDMRYLNVDHFSILNLDQSILGTYPTGGGLSLVEETDKINQCLDIHQFSLVDDGRGQDLLELERPVNININLANLNQEKYW